MKISKIIENINYPSLKRALNKENETKENVESLIQRTESWQKRVMGIRIFLSVITFGIINFFYLLGALAKNSSLKHQGKDDLVSLNFVKSHQHEADKVIKNFEKISKKQKQIVTAEMEITKIDYTKILREMETISEVTINTKVEKETIETKTSVTNAEMETIETKTSITKAEMEITSEEVEVVNDADFKQNIANCNQKPPHSFNKKSKGKGEEGKKSDSPIITPNIFSDSQASTVIEMENSLEMYSESTNDGGSEFLGEEEKPDSFIIGIGKKVVEALATGISKALTPKEKEEEEGDIENQRGKKDSFGNSHS